MPQEASNLLMYLAILLPLLLAPARRLLTGSSEIRAPYSDPSTKLRAIRDFAMTIPTFALLRETKTRT
jgi:hypothetical protein